MTEPLCGLLIGGSRFSSDLAFGLCGGGFLSVALLAGQARTRSFPASKERKSKESESREWNAVRSGGDGPRVTVADIVSFCPKKGGAGGLL